MLPQRPVEDRKAQQFQPAATLDAGSEHFNSFQFWREPVPALDSELLRLLVGATVCRSTTFSGSTAAPAANWLGVSRCRDFGLRIQPRLPALGASGRKDGREDRHQTRTAAAAAAASSSAASCSGGSRLGRWTRSCWSCWWVQGPVARFNSQLFT